MRLMLDKIAALRVCDAQDVIVADRADVASRFEQIVDKRINGHKLVIDNLPALAISPLFERLLNRGRIRRNRRNAVRRRKLLRPRE